METHFSSEAVAKANAKIDEWLEAKAKIEDPIVSPSEHPVRKTIRFARFVYRDLCSMLEEEIKVLIYHIAKRPPLTAFGLLSSVQGGAFSLSGEIWSNSEAEKAGRQTHWTYSAEEVASLTGLRHALASMYFAPVEHFDRVPIELWKDLADDFMRLVRERILESKVLAYEDPAMADLLRRSRAYQEKFAQMGYPGMLKGMGQ